jgi:CrcB protein
MQSVMLVGMAGAAGAVARYGVSLLAVRLLGDRFAFGTLAVNVLGCLLLGALLEAERHTPLVTHPLRLLLAVGFLGAFTTFSTFGWETFRYLQDGAANLAALNVAANLVLGLLAVWAGWGMARWAALAG